MYIPKLHNFLISMTKANAISAFHKEHIEITLCNNKLRYE